ncbi:hypothetical protein POM88_014305 [Heracleum sosnowskyi]|uniref:Retrotransposon gag domain-containing protein n=1 Tax=Heracleum sosnowskyi TaxID=360622 RepID=A0AAD8J1Q0_9APIA|nr:hypothetical protein POM88_014305 [Heracleum sosnowskyi]
MKSRVENIEDEVVILRRAVATSISKGPGETHVKLKVPEPKNFEGSRSAKELENFLWDMEQYFKAAHVQSTEQVTITSTYLAGDAKLWGRTHVDDDVNDGRPKIETWESLKKELKDQFLPNCA